ncbi:MAG TPA: M50 family metallopeptidase [Acidimicrobiia bacterium]
MKDPLDEASVEVTRRGAGVSLLILLFGLIVLAIVRPSTIDTIAIIFGIVALIMAHEAGHYFTAKRAGMKVTEFFLGFGPRVWSIRRGETEYGVKAIPAGGYVRIVGMNNLEEVDPEDEPRTYRQAKFSKRLTVVLAGVSVNIILAYFLLFGAVAGQGVPKLTTNVDEVVADSPASAAGLQKGDRIVAVEGTRVDDWQDLPDLIKDRAGVPTKFTAERNGTLVELTITPKERSKSDSSGFIGVSPRSVFERFSILASFRESFVVMWDTTKATGEGLGRFFSPAGLERYSKNFTGDEKSGSPSSADRPVSIIGIVDVGGQLVGGNIWALFGLLGVINLIVALFNLIPLPPFDGGHAAVAIYEQIASKIRGREVRVDYRKLIPVTALVLVVFLTLGLSAMFLDVRRIFTGS